ncbi:hypothetical protein ACT453_43695, partial [Bacillus sp. D-CC]
QPVQTKFADLNDSWGKDKANILVELDISQGVNKTEWLPNKTVTKAEAAKFIAKSDSLKIGNPLVEQVIMIDPGHGGTDLRTLLRENISDASLLQILKHT